MGFVLEEPGSQPYGPSDVGLHLRGPIGSDGGRLVVARDCS